MRGTYGLIAFFIFSSQTALANLPTILNSSTLLALKERAAKSVFIAQSCYHDENLKSEICHDGAVAAIELPEKSGPKKEEKLYLISTADWNLRSDFVNVSINGESVFAYKIKEDLENNIVLFESDITPGVINLNLAARCPYVVYSLLSPGTSYELLANFSLIVPATLPEKNYASLSGDIKNGYALLDAGGDICGLAVGKNRINAKNFAVHALLLHNFFSVREERKEEIPLKIKNDLF